MRALINLKFEQNNEDSMKVTLFGGMAIAAVAAETATGTPPTLAQDATELELSQADVVATGANTKDVVEKNL